MTSEKFKRRTIRLEPFVDNELGIIANKNAITINKLVSNIILEHITELDKINNVSNIETILKKLEDLESNINNLQKKCNWLNLIIKQIFINSGFAKNRKEEEDNIYKEFVNKRYDDKYDKKYNS